MPWVSSFHSFRKIFNFYNTFSTISPRYNYQYLILDQDNIQSTVDAENLPVAEEVKGDIPLPDEEDNNKPTTITSGKLSKKSKKKKKDFDLEEDNDTMG